MYMKYFLRNTPSSRDPMEVPFFTSPWAATPEDELFFISTLEKLGGIVQDDVKLGTLYITLILATPGAALSEKARVRIFYHLFTWLPLAL